MGPSMAEPPAEAPRRRSFGNPAIDRFLVHCHVRVVKPKSVLIKSGDIPDTLYFVLEGSVAVIIEDADGDEIVLAYLNEGEFFGEMGMFLPLARRSAWVRARGPSRIAEMSYSKFKQLAHEDPDLLFALSSQLAARLVRTTRKVGDLAFLDVTGRVARALLDLTREPDAVSEPDGIQVKVSRLELGRLVGCSREMAGRVLKSLEDGGHIRVKGKLITVLSERE
jgi:CRP/FNR family cyclic AMP-dependent transcriptional regulator